MKYLGWVKYINYVLMALTSALIFTLAAITFVDVIGRYFFSSPVPGAFEVQEVLMALIIFGGIPLVAYHGEHITVDLLDGFFARWKTVRRLQMLIVKGIAAAISLFLAFRLFDQGLDFLRWGGSSAFLRIPTYPVAFYMAAMMVLTSAVFISQLVIYIIDPSVDIQKKDTQ